MARKPIVLCVDDEPALLEVIDGQLISEDYELRMYSSGIDLLADPKSIEECDIILMDVMMPAKDGFEVTREIRSRYPRLLPILLITALGSTEHKVAGLDAGATDFITKPTLGAELRARVRAHLRSKQMHDELEHLNLMKDNLMKMIVHDLRIPLAGISLAFHGVSKSPMPELIDEQTWQLIRSQLDYGLMLCEQLLDITRLETDTLKVCMKPASALETVNTAVSTVSLHRGVQNVEFKVDVPDVEIATDHVLLGRVLLNLLINAAKYSPAGSEVEVRGVVDTSKFCIVVEDNGQGIPAEYQETVFQLFGSAEAAKETRGTGIGLAFCKMAIEALGGDIGVESIPGQGSSFSVCIPIEPQ